MPHNELQGSPQWKRPLEILQEMPREVAAILEAMPQAHYERIIAKQRRYMPTIAPGFFAWANGFAFLGEGLHDLGYLMHEEQNQPRLIGPAVQGIQPSFIVLNGDFEGEFIRVNNKGPVTRRYAYGNAPWQLLLPFEEYSQKPTVINIILVTRLEMGNILATYAVVPAGETDNKTLLKYIDLERLGTQDMNSYVRSSTITPARPDSVSNPFTLPLNPDETEADEPNQQDKTGTDG